MSIEIKSSKLIFKSGYHLSFKCCFRLQKTYIQTCSNERAVWLNDEPFLSQTELRAYDKLQIGPELFLFLPLCGARFAWEDYQRQK